MNDVAIYFSPHASSVTPEKTKNILTQSLFRYNVLTRAPQSIEELKGLIDIDLENNVRNFFIAGGDGTINLILQMLHNHPVRINVLPFGTANDLAFELGITQNISQIIKLFKHNSTKNIDVLSVNGIKFLTSGGMGLASSVSSEVNRLRKQFPWFKKTMGLIKGHTYSVVLIQQLLTKPLTIYELEIKSPALITPLVIKTPLLMINNQPTVGQDFCLAPNAKNDDKVFTVSIIKDIDKFKLSQTLYKLRVQKIIDSNSIFQFETDYLEINILSKQKSLFLGDGEDLTSDTRFKIKIEENPVCIFSHKKNESYSYSYDLEEVETL